MRAVAAPTDLPDADLCARFQSGDAEALEVLVTRYRRFARAKSRGYFLVGGDADDLEQEALIGLYKAVRDFRPEHEVSFRAFAELCITRQVITAIKGANRQKHQALNQYVSLSAPRHDGEDRCAEDLLPAGSPDPVDTVVSAERIAVLREAVASRLSDLEVEVLALYVEGVSYHEISERIGRHGKAVDNAVQRIKRKLGRELDDLDRRSLTEPVTAAVA
ncbi:MAG: RNA polymerase sporulation sigma factor SigH [Actinobacteria bacterium]|nr:RNA polymerase sporulation sigma factor SigH [Actinomycetota bacterium]